MTFKELRVKKGLSQQEIADCVGVKQTTISQYENGLRQPNLKVAKNISNVLGVSLDVFVDSLVFQNEITSK